MDFANRLQQLRKQQQWTQAVAAKHIDIQQSYLSKLENGLFHPSDDVIAKLCSAYNISPVELGVKQHKVNARLMSSLFCGLLGVVLFLLGQFALVYPQTYFTYQAQTINPIADMQQQTTANDVLAYHLTDSYLGEAYLVESANSKQQFTLIAKREVSREENRWLVGSGVFALLVCFFLLALPRLVQGKTS